MRFGYRKHKKKIIIGIFSLSMVMLIVSVVLSGKSACLANAFGVVVVPFQTASHSVNNFFRDKVESFTKLTELQEENKSLTKENEDLRFANSRLQALELENDRLSTLLETDNKYADFPTVGAHIIAKDPGNWYNSFLVDKGYHDQIAKNMVVIGDGGLIGRVVEVGKKYAKVVAMIDDTSTISAMSMRTEDIGYVKGDINLMLDGYCRMEFIDEDAQMMPGDEIVTSHLSSLYPPGITIGVVKEVIPDSNGTKYALIEPRVNFEKMEMVLIITEEFAQVYPDGLINNEGYIEQ